MTPQIALTLAIVFGAVLLFMTEKLRVDVIALLVLLTLALTGLVAADQVFDGFASTAVVTVWAIYIVSGGLFKTGVADMLGQRIIKLAGSGESQLTAVIMATCGAMSAFMNNIGATAVLLPAVGGISRQTKIPISRLLIPLAFASLLGGNMTLIGTPPNILATNILAERGLPTFRFFDFLPMGLLVFTTGILYMTTVGRYLLPVRETVEDLQTVHKLRVYVSEVRVQPNSPLIGRSLVQARLGEDYDITVLAVLHGGNIRVAITRDTRLQADDLLLVQAPLDNLVQARKELGLAIEADKSLAYLNFEEETDCIVEATLAPRSRFEGLSLREIRFRDRYGFTALAIWRYGAIVTQRLRDVQLRFGDALLLQGPRRQLNTLRANNQFLVMEPVELETRRRDKAPLAVGILLLVLGLVTLVKLDIAVAMVSGAMLMVLSGALTMEEAYQSIEWKSIFLIGGMLPLGAAMENTGAAGFLANLMVDVMWGLGPLGLLAGVYILTALITQPMSNAAATVLIIPIAIDVALSTGASPLPFALATVIAASTSFLTPVGHQANVLVFGPGGYRFFDYTRVGAPLNLLLWLLATLLIPLWWPLTPVSVPAG